MGDINSTLLSPLAERMRPKKLSDFFGQEHLTSEGKPLRNFIEKNRISSFILWGPPGSGKTTIAKIIAYKSNADFYQLNAVSSGVKDIREITLKATENLQKNVNTLLFIDEIHRFNKAQQDALLSAVESGLIYLIGATTENPSFEVIPALRSRMRIYKLNELMEEDIWKIVVSATLNDIVLKDFKITFEENISGFIWMVCGGDARAALNIIEMIVNTSNTKEILIDKQTIENAIQKKNIIYDKDGEEHYNLISAFIKSIRGSSPDAAVYWLARMIEGGEDPLFIARRMIILASEDIGNANPNCLLLAQAVFSAVERVGMPEGRIPLAHCAIYLASSQKSNAAYMAIEKALEDVRRLPQYQVPLKLRNAVTDYMKKEGYGKDYRYAHSYEGNFIKDTFLPEEIKSNRYYFPSENGNEKAIKDYLNRLWGESKK